MEQVGRRRERLVVVAIVAVLAAIAAPAFRGEMVLFNDLGAFHLPFRAFYQSQIQRGESPAWHPGVYNGYDLHAEGQVGMAHPAHFLLYRALPLALAFHTELLLNAITALVGMFLFLRRWVDRRDAALAGAAAFALGGFSAAHTQHPNIVAAAAHLPWLLWSMDGLVRAADRRARARWGLALGMATASQWLHAHPQFLWYSAMAEAAYALFLAWRTPGLLVQLAAWKGAGLLAAGVQIVPTVAAVRGSFRGEVDAEFLALGSLPPSNLLQLVMPYLYQSRVVAPATMVYGTPLGPALDYSDWRTGEFGFGLGMVPLALMLWLVTRRAGLEPRERRLLAWSVVVGGLAFVLALGDYSPLFRWLIRVPTFGMFRVNARAVLLIDLALCIWVAVAASHLARAAGSRETAERPNGGVWLLPAMAAAAVVLAPRFALLFPNVLPREGFSPAWLHALGLGLAFVASGLVFWAARGRSTALTLAMLLLVAELGVSWWTYIRQVPPMRLEAFLETIEVPPSPPPARVVSDDDRLTLRGYALTGGYASLTPLSRPRSRFEGARRAAGASWIESNPPGQPRVWEPVEAPMPRARLVTEVRLATAPDPGLGTIDVAREALVEVGLPAFSGTPGDARVILDRPGRIVLRTETASRQLLVLTERFDPGWRVELDGRRTASLRVNDGFLGCVVPPGSHRLRFRYAPRSHAIGAWVSLLGISLMFGFAILAHMDFPPLPARRVRAGREPWVNRRANTGAGAP